MNKIRNQKSKIKNQKLFIYPAILILNFVFAAAVFAIGGGGGEHVTTWKDWLWPVVNFGIIVAVLVYFGRKPIKEYFRKRTELIEKSLKDATEAKELARKTLDEVQGRLKNTELEINKILEASGKTGEREKEALIAQGESLRNKILEQTRANIEFELEKAKKSIKSEAALMALELAEKQIKEKLGRKEQEGLIDEYIKKLEVGN
ncbi:MAG: F0F1 ATP synthase subunit B, partial [Candidatus Scalindua sp.]